MWASLVTEEDELRNQEVWVLMPRCVGRSVQRRLLLSTLKTTEFVIAGKVNMKRGQRVNPVSKLPGPEHECVTSKGDVEHGLWHRVRMEHGHWLNTSWRVKAVSCINYHSDFSKCLSSEEELLRSTHWFICWAFTPGRSYFNPCRAHVCPALGSEMHLDEVLEICLYPCVL